MVIIIVLILATVLSLIYVWLLMTSSKYENYITPLNDKEFPLKTVYGVGFRALEVIKFKYSGKGALNLRRQAVILYGDKYGDYYVRVFYAQRIALAFTTLVATLLLSCMSGEENVAIMLLLSVVVTVTIYYYFAQQSTNTISKLSQKYIREFPGIVSSIALLVNAGMVLREAWDIVAESADTEMHQQMRQVSVDRNNGYSEPDALSAMAKRCSTPEISKFVSMVIQGLSKGSKDLAYTLKEQSDELWALKQQKLLQEGEKASGRLLIPILIMFVGVLLMIMLPIMSTL